MRSRSTVRRLAALFAFAVSLGAAATQAQSATDPSERERTRATMQKIFESIRVLLPLSVDAERFAAPEQRATIEQALAALHDNADALAAHARTDDPARRYLGASLAADARQALDRYRAGHFDGAAFQIQQTTENCVACHTKLRSPGDSPAAKHFVHRPALAKLPLAQKARLEVATRQFADAAKTYEKLLASRDIHPGELLAPLGDYLILEVRVRGEFDRARKTLEQFAKRPDLWRGLRADVEQWSRSLREFAPLRDRPAELATARGLIDKAREKQRYPADRSTLVHYLVASSLLQRFIETPPATDREAAEAYYLLGLCETHVGDDYWVSQADLYLETAIRLAPAEPFAEEAFALLEEETLVGYTGSGGPHLPESVAEHLEELRELIDR